MKLPVELRPGLAGNASLTVGSEHTAPHVGSGAVPVLATPVMVNLMEAAALDAVERLLPAGCQTLGTRLDVRHFAATPVGVGVRASAVLTDVTGRVLTFELSAEDDHEPIGDGTHERIVVDVARFEARVARKR